MPTHALCYAVDTVPLVPKVSIAHNLGNGSVAPRWHGSARDLGLDSAVRRRSGDGGGGGGTAVATLPVAGTSVVVDAAVGSGIGDVSGGAVNERVVAALRSTNETLNIRLASGEQLYATLKGQHETLQQNYRTLQQNYNALVQQQQGQAQGQAQRQAQGAAAATAAAAAVQAQGQAQGRAGAQAQGQGQAQAQGQAPAQGRVHGFDQVLPGRRKNFIPPSNRTRLLTTGLPLSIQKKSK